ncbi:GumC family protein [Sphingomonas prati]|uniref:non-specific protein-tyrosine kinase n=1 Tax=Sphingomonas prati TaxID=1843237 RepID=A0A7W9F1D9_9SPHN|nr:AAA family ATPase [Sphingomonas prati]MBB5729213.1 capsular exopolysaccharide synthesis family protein [Sphingomonas prati]GGE84262.1 chromosome partitioning protein ParA [Sphingomonas prati]
MEIRHDADEREAKLADIFAIVRETVRRRWLTLLIVTAVVFVPAAIYIMRLTPIFQATARMRIDPSRNPLANTATGASAEPSSSTIDTEASAMNSVELARTVARKLKLADNPEFNGALKTGNAAAMSTAAGRESAIAGSLLAGLSVAREKLTYVLDVQYRSPNPVAAARIANAFAESYIESRVADKAGTASRQGEWFDKRLADLGEQVMAADARVAQFRAQAGIVGSDPLGEGGTIVDQQIAPLTGTLANAESDAAAARSNLGAARAQVSRGGLDAVSEVLNSPVIADLRRQRAEVLRDTAVVEAKFGPKHPESIRVRDQLTSLDSQIQAESRRVVNSLQATAAAAEARASSLRGSLNNLQTQRERDSRAAALASSYEREAAAKRALYERMSQLSLGSTQAAQVSLSQAAIIDRADVPTHPTSPNRPLLLALAAIVALVAGAGTIGVQEAMAGGLRTSEEVQAQLGVPVLAAIPNEKARNPADILIDRPTSFFAESLRIARASILGVRDQAPPQVIAITSALPSEGKTTTALAFARTLAAADAKTLLIECDVRRAAMRHLVRTPATSTGLVEVLQGKATLTEGIVPSDVPNLDQLLVSVPFYSAEDLFGGEEMRQILDAVRAQYTHIVLDLPPILGLADGRFISVLADAVVLIVRWGVTPAAAAKAAHSLLRNDGGNTVGVIYTMVDSSAEVMGGLYYSKYYAKNYSKYYNAE